MVAKTSLTLGLDVGLTAVKAVALQRNRDRVTVTGVGYVPLSGPEHIIDGLREAATQTRASVRKARLVTAISGRSVVVRLVALRDGSPDDLRLAARNEAEKFIPYDIGEAQIDIHPMSTAGGGEVQTLLIIARRQAVDDQIALIKAAGFSPNVIDYDGFALANAFELANRDGAMAAATEALGLVDLGASKTTITTMQGPNCLSREVYTAGQSMTETIAHALDRPVYEAEQLKTDPGEQELAVKNALRGPIEDLAAEIKTSCDNFKAAFGADVSRLLFCGGGSRFGGLVDLFGRLLELNAGEFTPFAFVDVAGGGDVVAGRSGELAVALGLAAYQ